MWFMYTMEYYSAIRNDKYPPFASMWMELEGIMLREVSQSEKHIIIWFHSYGEYKKQRDYRGKERKWVGKNQRGQQNMRDF